MESRIMNISIAKDFSDVPSGRYYTDGDWTGQKFRDEFLIPNLKKSRQKTPCCCEYKWH
jgi:hypothetical protein